MKRSKSPLAIYSSTGPLERMLAALGFITPLLVNLECTTAKPKAGGCRFVFNTAAQQQT